MLITSLNLYRGNKERLILNLWAKASKQDDETASIAAYLAHYITASVIQENQQELS